MYFRSDLHRLNNVSRSGMNDTSQTAPNQDIASGDDCAARIDISQKYDGARMANFYARSHCHLQI